MKQTGDIFFEKEIKKLRERRGITLIALVITIIVLLILAGIFILMLSGDNGILQRSAEAKVKTAKSQEKEIVALAYNAALTKKASSGASMQVTAEDLNYELTNQGATADGSNPIKVTFTDSKRQYTIENGIVEQKSNYQWEIVSDNDNDGVLSIGDEVKPLIDSIKNEHFYVIANNEDGVKLITKLGVDHVTNSQSLSAEGVSYDMAYCDLEGVKHDFNMPKNALKSPSEVVYVRDSEDENIILYEYEIPAEYYDGVETVKIHCTGTYTKNYGLKLVQAGLQLMDYNSTGCTYIGLPHFEIGDEISPALLNIVGNSQFHWCWCDYYGPEDRIGSIYWRWVLHVRFGISL